MARLSRRMFPVALCLATAVAAQADELVNDFGDGLQSWRFDFGSPITPSLTRDASEGSPGNAAGALRMDMTFVSSQGGNNRFAFTGDLFFPGRDLTGFESLKYDLKVAPGSALDAFGNHGFLQFVSRETDGYTWGNQPGFNISPADGWRTITIPTTGNGGLDMAETRAFTLQLYGGPSQNIDGQITLFLDNVRLVVPEPGAAVLALLGFAAAPLRRR